MDSEFERRANQLIAASDGAIWLESGDRDHETQTRLWNEAVAKYGPEEARNWVAPPGHSNHEKGIAIDFGGDMELLARLAPQYGLHQPMSWEPWHWEPIGSRDGSTDPQAYSIKPSSPSSLVRATNPRDYGDVMRELLNIKSFNPTNSSADIALSRGGTDPIISSNPGFMNAEMMAIFGPLDKLLTPGQNVKVPGTGVNDSFTPLTPISGSQKRNSSLQSFMYALREVESSHNYRAIGVPTPWGTAKGAYQYLDSTWNNYGGYASADQAPPEVQDEKAAADMQAYYDEYGSWDNVSAAWYSGPNGDWQSGEVREYVSKVGSKL